MAGNVEYELKFFGHYQNPEKNSDKIWGWVLLEGKMYNFWGRRDKDGSGKSVKFKVHKGMSGRHDLAGLVGKKERKGYQRIPLTRNEDGTYPDIEAIYPNFVANMMKKLMFERLTGRVRGEEV